jgi:hypothetical protein
MPSIDKCCSPNVPSAAMKPEIFLDGRLCLAAIIDKEVY